MKGIRMTRDLRGMRIGRLTVLDWTDCRSGGSILWKCSCLCGNTALIASRDLLHAQNRKGCGNCWDSKHPLYGIWQGIISRCERSDSAGYENYGGRGISMCSRWRNEFLFFVQDMGLRPSQRHSVERLDVNGNYEPSNCIWATWLEQANNQRQNKLAVDEETILKIYFSDLHSSKLAEQYNLSYHSIENIKSLWYGDEARRIIARFLGISDTKNRKKIAFATMKYKMNKRNGNVLEE